MRAALIEIDGGAIIAIGDLPFTHLLADGGTALLTDVGQEVPVHDVTYRVMEYVEAEFDSPGTYYTQGDDIETRDGDVITVRRQWAAWTQGEIDAYETARLDAVAGEFDDVDAVERATALVLLGELNLHADAFAAILAAAAGAASLAAFKTAMAAITPVPHRTAQQLKAAIRAELGT